MIDITQRGKEIKENVLKYHISKSDPFSQMVMNGLSLKGAQQVAKQYYPVNLAFPLFLAAAISHIQNNVARILLVDNLYEEHGSSNIEESHTRLFERFIKATGLDPKDYKIGPSNSPEEMLVNEYNNFCFNGKQHTALGVLYAFEELFSPISEALSQSLKKSAILTEEDYMFFPIHGVVDIEHANKLRNALLEVVSTDNDWSEVLKASEIGAKTLFTLFDDIARNSI